MLLRKRPTYFVKGDDRRRAFYTVQARELIERGYVEEGTDTPDTPQKPDKTPEVPVIAGEDAYETVSSVLEEDVEVDLKSLKKADLVEYAESLGIDVQAGWLKADLIAAIEGLDNE